MLVLVQGVAWRNKKIINPAPAPARSCLLDPGMKGCGGMGFGRREHRL